MTVNPSLPPTPPKKTNPWLIVGGVLLVLCCACFGSLGLILAFGQDLLNAFGL
jgi:hypothetical protein